VPAADVGKLDRKLVIATRSFPNRAQIDSVNIGLASGDKLSPSLCVGT
jgi:hypothetical protein